MGLLDKLRPQLSTKDGITRLLVDGKPFTILGGELHNSSASTLVGIDALWDKLAALNLNTVLAPLCWDQIEPEEGRFDFTVLDGMLNAAHRHSLRLVFLWFGTWKNASSCYAPPWVKKELERFPRLQCRPGENANAISCLSRAACEADAKAFTAVMRHIRNLDEQRRIVLMMQVENETGVLGAARDQSAEATAAFAGPVPTELMAWLEERRETLGHEVKFIWGRSGFRAAGTWTEVFGRDADEVFMAWHVARYVGQVAAAGREEYALPVFANAWLVQHDGQPAGRYPSGGPVSRMHDIWRAAAPRIDFFAPDIYLDDFCTACGDYAKPGPLFIPEAKPDERAASAVLYALGQHAALGFSPFGIDDLDASHPLAATYGLLSGMNALLAQHTGTGRTAAVFQQREKETWKLDLGGYRLHVSVLAPKEKNGTAGGLFVALNPDEFLIVGRNVSVVFSTPGAERPDVELLSVEQGLYKLGKWVCENRPNGDESWHGRAVVFGATMAACRVTLNGAAPMHFMEDY